MGPPDTQLLVDHQGRPIREPLLAETLAGPDRVVQSSSDPDAHLYYRYYRATTVGDKHLCVVVKTGPEEAFVVTAYLTDTIKKGEEIWPAPN